MGGNALFKGNWRLSKEVEIEHFLANYLKKCARVHVGGFVRWTNA